MTDQEIMQLARDSGFSTAVRHTEEDIIRFAALVAEREREACLAEIDDGIWIDKTTEEVLDEIAEAIRARSKKENQQ